MLPIENQSHVDWRPDLSAGSRVPRHCVAGKAFTQSRSVGAEHGAVV